MPVDSTWLPDENEFYEPIVIRDTYIEKPKYTRPETATERLIRLKKEKRLRRAIKNGRKQYAI